MTPIKPNISDFARHTIAEVARLLDLHRNTVSNLLKNGEVKYTIKKNGRKCIMGSEIKRIWLERG